jgi:hypothetical protein
VNEKRDTRGLEKPESEGPNEHLVLERISLEIGKLPRLLIVAIDAVLPHEEPDERRIESIRGRIAAEGLLKHPLIAARSHDTVRHILLEGVNRREALRGLGARFVPVQEVDLDDEGLVLSTWHHAVEGLDAGEFIGHLPPPARVAPFGGDFRQTGDFVPRFSEERTCCIALPDGRSFAVLGDGSTRRRAEGIRDLVRRISAAGSIDRVSYTNMRDLARHYPRFSALVCYRGFSKEDVRSMSAEGVKLPSGVTRFSVRKRALAFGIPLSLLQGDGTREEKQAGLDRMIIEKIRGRRIKFFEEPTFYFDD